MDAWSKTAVMAASLVALAGASASADPVTDFTALRGWSLMRCETIHWSSGAPASTVCINGSVTLGYSAGLAEYGFRYGFADTPPSQPAPSGGFVSDRMDGVSFIGSDGANPIFLFAGCFAEGCISPTSGGQLFSPFFSESSTLGGTFAEFHATDLTNPRDPMHDDRFGALTVIPEPATFALLAPGVLGIGAMARWRRRGR